MENAMIAPSSGGDNPFNKFKGTEDIVGNYEILPEFYSRFLKNERDIIIWFPPSYNYSFKRYPVLYMQDGQNLFNPNTSFIGYDWRVDETALNLIEAGLMEEIIVVGIYNTRYRLEEYNLFTRKGINYSKFITAELKPFIDDHYRTSPDRNNTAVSGSSLGGLYSFQLFWSLNHIFGKAACLSNSFWIDDKRIFNFVNDYSPSADSKLYIDCGTNEKELLDDNKLMDKTIKKLNLFDNSKYKFHLEAGASHTETDWAARFEIPLKFLFSK